MLAEVKTLQRTEKNTITLVIDSDTGTRYIRKELCGPHPIYAQLQALSHLYLPKIFHVEETRTGVVLIEGFIDGANLAEITLPEKQVNQEASEVTILSVDQPALSLSIPKAWEDIAIIKRQTDIQQSAEAKDGTLLFQLYEKTAYTTDEAMGNVWSLVAFTKDAFKEKFGDADLATVIGVESYVLGSDSDYIYLLVRPSDVQFLENDDTSLKQYKQLQQESQVVLAGFLKDNSITVNEDCPNSSCYKVAHGANK